MNQLATIEIILKSIDDKVTDADKTIKRISKILNVTSIMVIVCVVFYIFFDIVVLILIKLFPELKVLNNLFTK